MKIQTAATALAIVLGAAFAAPAAEARVAQHHKGSHVSSGVQAKNGAKKPAKAKHKKKAGKKAHKKSA